MPILTVYINGDECQINSNTLSELLMLLRVDPVFLAVAVNNNIVPSTERGELKLRDGDHVEIIRPVCGG